MKNIIVALIMVCLITNGVVSQTNQDFSSYVKQPVFSEKFIDNENNWRKFYTKIKKGKYSIETIGNNPAAISTIPVQMDLSRNYEIETVVSIEWNRSDEFMGIVWTRDLNNGYYLAFNKDFKTKVYKRENNAEIAITEVEELSVYRPMFAENTITIRKIDSEFLIYINKILVYTIPFNHHFGNHIGYFVGLASELKAYELAVSYLN